LGAQAAALCYANALRSGEDLPVASLHDLRRILAAADTRAVAELLADGVAVFCTMLTAFLSSLHH